MMTNEWIWILVALFNSLFSQLGYVGEISRRNKSLTALVSFEQAFGTSIAGLTALGSWLYKLTKIN